MALLLYVLSLVLLTVALLDASRHRMRLSQQLAGPRLLELRSEPRFSFFWVARLLAAFLWLVVWSIAVGLVIALAVDGWGTRRLEYHAVLMPWLFWCFGLLMANYVLPSSGFEIREKGLVGRDTAGSWFLPWSDVRLCHWNSMLAPRLFVHTQKCVLAFDVMAQQRDEAMRVLRPIVRVSDGIGPTDEERSPCVERMGARMTVWRARRLGLARPGLAQFTLRNALLWLLFFSTTFSLLGIAYRQHADESWALAKLGEFLPLSQLADADVRLDLSAVQRPLSDADLLALEKLPRLRRLTLAGHPITDTGLAHLGNCSQLRLLDLTGTQVTDAGLVHLERLKALQFLCLQNTQVTADGIARLKQSLPDVMIIDQPVRP